MGTRQNIETKTGADLGGSSGDTDRTYTLLRSTTVLESSLSIIVNGVHLHLSLDYTISSGVITFLNVIVDYQKIQLQYEDDIGADTSASSTLKYSSVLALVKYLGLLDTVPNRTDTEKELVGTGNSSTTDFWISKLGIIENKYTLYYGTTQATTTELTETTHYTLDLDNSKVVLTSAGVTLVAANNIYTAYSYNTSELLSNEMVEVLNAAETKVELFTEQRFANYTDTNPTYRKITNEQIQGHYNPVGKVFEGFFNPWVKLSTTTDGAFTLGDTTLSLTDATGFPTTGTIYVDGNKVTYTGKSSNNLTVPNTTPSVDDDSVVAGEVVEISKEPEGNALSFEVLDPDTEYEIDYLNGYINPLSNAFWGEISAEDRLYPSNYVVRVSYFAAWHEKGTNPIVRDDIQEVVNMIAAKKFAQRMIKKAHVAGLNEFNPGALDSGDDEILRTLEYYKPLNVGLSQHDKQFVSGGSGYGY